MPTKLDLTDLNNLFNNPPPPLPPTVQSIQDKLWLSQFYARLHSTVDSSPLSSNATLVEDDDDLMDHFNVCKLEDPFFAVPDVDSDLRPIEDPRPLYLNTNIPLDLSTPSSPSPASSLGTNPFAVPFVPSQFTTPLWFSTFWIGVSTDDVQVHNAYSIDLVNSTQWTTQALADLAQHFCWKGADPTTDVCSVAPFARAVHDRFRETYGDLYANSLTRHIREIVVGHFKACWKSVSPSFLPHPDPPLLTSQQDQPYSITYPNPPSIPYLTSAHTLTTFIGDLFSQGLLPRSTIHHCLSILIAELTSIEHMHAIHLLLLHANTKLWKGKDANATIKDFVANFTQRSTRMGERSSILGHEITKDELQAKVKVAFFFFTLPPSFFLSNRGLSSRRSPI